MELGKRMFVSRMNVPKWTFEDFFRADKDEISGLMKSGQMKTRHTQLSHLEAR